MPRFCGSRWARPFIAWLGLVLLLFATAPVAAQDKTGQDGASQDGAGQDEAGQDGAGPAVLRQIFADTPLPEDRFTPEFLAQVPVVRLEQIVGDLTQRFGALREVETAASGYVLHLERANVPTQLVLDAEGRVAGLWFQPPQLVGGSLEDQVATIADLPGRTALLVLSDGAEQAALAADDRLAVGSAFKLAVLKAVGDAVAAGRLSWDQVVPLRDGWRSLPSGILQDWPAGLPLTLATLAGLAVSLSDNTATDALIDLVGRAAVEAVAPENAPFLTTRELFILKAPDNDSLRQAWRQGDAAARQALLARIDQQPLPTVAAFQAGGVSADIEWFFSARALCRLLDAVASQPAFRINPGLASRDDWRQIAFKGGSEPGVLNLSTRLVGTDGRVHCVVATWNSDAALDGSRLTVPYQRILALLAEG